MSVPVDHPVAEGPEQAASDPRPGRRTKWLLVGGAMLASAMGGGLAISALTSSPSPSPSPSASADTHSDHAEITTKTRPITRKQLASQYGIRLTLVGVTAGGGLVDLRFKITDAKKARKLFNGPSVMPAVVAEPTGTVLQGSHGGHGAKVKPRSGASYFMLIGNAGGVVQDGVPVTVQFNSVRVENVIAQT